MTFIRRRLKQPPLTPTIPPKGPRVRGEGGETTPGGPWPYCVPAAEILQFRDGWITEFGHFHPPEHCQRLAANWTRARLINDPRLAGPEGRHDRCAECGGCGSQSRPRLPFLAEGSTPEQPRHRLLHGGCDVARARRKVRIIEEAMRAAEIDIETADIRGDGLDGSLAFTQAEDERIEQIEEGKLRRRDDEWGEDW
jgi:hypothetical protein